MKPYYADDLVTLYHGDCREVLPWFADADLLLADPPYGMNHEPTRRGNGSKIWGAHRIAGDDQPFDPSHLLDFPRVVLWGANWYADKLPPSGGWLVWDKTPDFVRDGFTASHAELAWTNVGGMVRKFSQQWGGSVHGGEPHFHPTQKPQALMRWCIGLFTEPGMLVLDPYAGSGSALVAAKAMGRRAVGVELDERHCQTAAERLSQNVLDLGGAA